MKSQTIEIPTPRPEGWQVGGAFAPFIICISFLAFWTLGGLIYGGLPRVEYWAYYVIPALLIRALMALSGSTVLFDKSRGYIYFRHRNVIRYLEEKSEIALEDIASVITRMSQLQGMRDDHSGPSSSYNDNQHHRQVPGRIESNWSTLANLENGDVIGFGQSYVDEKSALAELQKISAYLEVPLEPEERRGPIVGRFSPEYAPTWPAFVILLALLYCAMPLIIMPFA